MKYIIITLSLLTLSSATLAFEIPSIFKSAKKKIQRLVGIETQEIQTLELPKIPNLKDDATNTQVYEKNGNIFKQGESFNKLTNDEKRPYRIAYLNDLYEAVLMQKINHNELVKYLNVLEQNGTREGVYRSLAFGEEYKALELRAETTKKVTVDFTMSFAATYLALEFSKENVEKLNTWAIKRIVAEKSLEIMDAFASDGADLYQWYAVLSVKLAEDYGSILNNESRKSTDFNFHHQWAQKVPIQQVKSEVVVKLHRIYNYLR